MSTFLLSEKKKQGMAITACVGFYVFFLFYFTIPKHWQCNSPGYCGEYCLPHHEGSQN